MSTRTKHRHSWTLASLSLLGLAPSTACTVEIANPDPLTSSAGSGSDEAGEDTDSSTDTDTGMADEVGETGRSTFGETAGEETEEGDPWETGENFECDPEDPYCPLDGCPGTMGEEVIIDIDQDGDADFSWCLHECIADEFCPRGSAYVPAQITCSELESGTKACIPTCGELFSVCPDPAVCSDVAGPPLCLYGDGL